MFSAIARSNEGTDVITWLTIAASVVALTASIASFWLHSRRAIPKPTGLPLSMTVALATPPMSSPASSVADLPAGGEPDALEKLLASSSVGPDTTAQALLLLAHSTVLALGQAIGEPAQDGLHTESDLLHFTADENGEERTFLPIFTRADTLRRALERYPDWRDQAVLEISAGDLLAARDPNVAVAVNPWSHLALEIPPDSQAIPPSR